MEANGTTADFVFSDGYQPKNLANVGVYIKEYKHFPEVPNTEALEE